MKIAVFPGSFDPFTLGHQDVIRRAIPLFDKIIIAIGKNASKKYMFSLEQRLEWINEIFKDEDKVETDTFSGLTTNYCKEKGASFILRGLRNPADFEYEKTIALANGKLEPSVETLFLLTSGDLSFISSSIVRDVMRHNGDYQHFVPDAVRI